MILDEVQSRETLLRTALRDLYNEVSNVRAAANPTLVFNVSVDLGFAMAKARQALVATEGELI